MTDPHLASMLEVLFDPSSYSLLTHSWASEARTPSREPATPARRLASLSFVDAKQLSGVTTASRGQSCPVVEAQVVETYECLLRSGPGCYVSTY